MVAHGLHPEIKQARLNRLYDGEAYTLLHAGKGQGQLHLWLCNTCKGEFVRSYKALLYIKNHCPHCAVIAFKNTKKIKEFLSDGDNFSTDKVQEMELRVRSDQTTDSTDGSTHQGSLSSEYCNDGHGEDANEERADKELDDLVRKKAAGLMPHPTNPPCDWGSIDMHIGDRKKYGDSRPFPGT